MKCVINLMFFCVLPPQVHYPPYLFECFLFAPVYDKNSAAQIGNGIVLFKLEKQQSEIWEQLNNPDAGKGFSKEKILQKYEITMEVRGCHWVGPGLTRNLLFFF